MSFLSEIIARKRTEVATRRATVSDSELESRIKGGASRASLFAALSPRGGPTRVIAELKRASPSVGTIHKNLDPQVLASSYAQAGAAAISVLTDGPGFGGSLADLEAVRRRVSVPLLRKDFVIDRYQLLEARVSGADAVLLIVAALKPETLKLLHADASALGLDVLTEVHDAAELAVAVDLGARIIGVNSRNLHTFVVDLAVCETLLPRIPAEARAIAESGIKGPSEVNRLRAVGASNFLIGEALVRAPDAGALLRSLREAEWSFG